MLPVLAVSVLYLSIVHMTGRYMKQVDISELNLHLLFRAPSPDIDKLNFKAERVL